MDILETLRFVRGAVSTKDLVPEMKHFVIENGTVRSFNGVIAICSPIDFAFDCKPKAFPMVSAIGHCDEVVTLGMTDGGRLRIQSGRFKAFIECIEGETIHLLPEGKEVPLDGEALVQGCKTLLPFVGNDASRPWTNGILLRGQSAFATNNVCLAEYWLGVDVPFTVNIPMAAIKEIVRVKQIPTHAQISDHSITIHYEDGCWIRSQLYETDWPDLSKILDRTSHQRAVPENLFEALTTIKPFVDKRGLVHFIDGEIRTHLEEGLGAGYQVDGLHGDGVYHISMLGLLEGVAKTVDFSLYPEPLIFYGDRLRGAIVGLRL